MKRSIVCTAFWKSTCTVAATGFGMVVASLSLPAAAVSAPLTFYACQKDGKVIPGTIQVGEKPKCSGGAKSVWWAQGSNVKVFGGAVASDGSVLSGSGFTVEHVSAGKYHVTFAPGLVTQAATLSVTPYGFLYGYTNPVVAGSSDLGDGSRLYEIRLSGTTPGETPYDNPFMFIVVQPAP
jgi:hypothetical protein